MIYKGTAFRALYVERLATSEELRLQRKVERRRKLVVELDDWVRRHCDPRLHEGKTADFVGWGVENKRGEIEAVVADAHAYTDAHSQV